MSLPADEALHYFDENQAGMSPQRLNARGRTAGTAAYIKSLSPTWPGQSVRVIKEGDATLKIDRSYARDSWDTKWLPETGIKHLHNADTDEAGGYLRDALGANFNGFVFINPATIRVDSLYTEVASGAVWTNGTGSIILTTNASSGAYGNAQTTGPVLSFGKWIMAAIRCSFNSGTRMTLKWGVRMESVQTDPGATMRFGVEACDTAGTPRNFNIVSGDGNTWSSTPTLEPVADAGGKGYRCSLEPNSYVVMEAKDWNSFTEVVTIKTNNIPYALYGTTASSDAFKIGYRTNEAASKIMTLYNYRVIGDTHPYYW
jgi:hypothetical protein